MEKYINWRNSVTNGLFCKLMAGVMCKGLNKMWDSALKYLPHVVFCLFFWSGMLMRFLQKLLMSFIVFGGLVSGS